MVPLAEHDRHQQLHPPARRPGRRRTLSVPHRLQAVAPATASSSATSTPTAPASCPASSAASLDGTSTSAWGRNFLKSHSIVGGWTKVLAAPRWSTRCASRGRAAMSGRPTGSVRPGRHGRRSASRACPSNRTSPGGIVGIDIPATSGYGSPNFMPKYPAHRPGAVPRIPCRGCAGKHQFKFGADIMTPMNNEYFDIPSTRGNLGFPAQFTGNAFADFMLGYARHAELSNVHVVNQRRWSTAFFVQDDWRPTSRLTLNLGLRYDFMTPSLRGRQRAWPTSIRRRARCIRARTDRCEDRALVRPDRNNFAPRVGVVYQAERQDGDSRRLRHLLQPARSDRLRRSARAQPARACATST